MREGDGQNIEVYKPEPELVRKVLALTRDGLNREQIHQWAQELPEKPSRDEIDASLASAAQELCKAGMISIDMETGRSISRMHDLYARMHQTGDLRGCLTVQNNINKILGITNPKTSIAVRNAAMAIVDIAGKYIDARDQNIFIEDVKAFFKR